MKKVVSVSKTTPREQLDRHQNAGRELRRVCLFYLSSMQQNMTAGPADSESIHQFRVSGKRLRALCHLMRDLYPEDSAQLSRTIADCGRCLSGSRDKQVQHALLSSLYPDTPENVQSEIQAWLEQHDISDINTAPSVNKTVKHLDKLLSPWIKHFKVWQPELTSWSPLFYRWQITRTKDLKFTQLYIKGLAVDLHDWRKISKRHLYQSELLNLESPSCHKQLKQKNQLLGDWHDLDILQHTVSGDLKDYLIQLQQQIEQQLLSQVLTTKELL